MSNDNLLILFFFEEQFSLSDDKTFSSISEFIKYYFRSILKNIRQGSSHDPTGPYKPINDTGVFSHFHMFLTLFSH